MSSNVPVDVGNRMKVEASNKWHDDMKKRIGWKPLPTGKERLLVLPDDVLAILRAHGLHPPPH